MRRVNAILTLVVILSVTLASESALARGGGHGGRSGSHFGGSHFSGSHISGSRFSGRHFGGPRVPFGIIVGAPAFWYYPPFPYYPPVVAAPFPPPVYIEQGGAQSTFGQPQEDWYYCADRQAYYPYVKECPGGWQQVSPQPPPPQ